MTARLIILLPDQAAQHSLLPPRAAAYHLGREQDCDVVLTHPTISRRHATLTRLASAWQLEDGNSKNGTFVGDSRTTKAQLDKQAWLRFGDVYVQFEQITSQQAERFSQQRNNRLAMTRHLQITIKGGLDFAASMQDVLKSVLDLGQFERGFILLRDPLKKRMAVAAQQASTAIIDSTDSDFQGTVSALQRCIDKRDSVIYNDIDTQHWLSARASVVAEGIRALAVVPLMDEQQLIGLIYCDRTSSLQPLTDLDIALLESFAQQASISLAMVLMQHSLDELDQQLGGSATASNLLEVLQS